MPPPGAAARRRCRPPPPRPIHGAQLQRHVYQAVKEIKADAEEVLCHMHTELGREGNQHTINGVHAASCVRLSPAS